jgi:hypothetical protein
MYLKEKTILLVLGTREEQREWSSRAPEDVAVSEGRTGQDRLDAIAKRRQPLVIKKRASYAYVLDEDEAAT